MTTPKQWRRAYLCAGPEADSEEFEVIEIGALLEEQENTRFYKKEWESACERADYAKELEAEVERWKGNWQEAIDVSAGKNNELRSENAALKRQLHDVNLRTYDGVTEELALRERQLERMKEQRDKYLLGAFPDEAQRDTIRRHCDVDIEEMGK